MQEQKSGAITTRNNIAVTEGMEANTEASPNTDYAWLEDPHFHQFLENFETKELKGQVEQLKKQMEVILEAQVLLLE